MMQIRKSESRGRGDYQWLQARYTFSFASYHDPEQQGFRDLLVMNEDRVAPGRGFAPHSHQNMEIITYVLDGELEHKDSLGTTSVLRHGRVQRMTAGTGIQHSEFNHSKENPLHLYQIWIFPAENGLPPSYEEKNFDLSEPLNLLVSPTGQNGSIRIHQDVTLYSSIMSTGQSFNYKLAKDRHAWLQVARGQIDINGLKMAAGDGVAISNETDLKVQSLNSSELLLFDLR